MMTGCGPPRSGWVMKVVTWPSLVAISICWSIMGVSSRLVSRFFALAIDTIARKPEHDKATFPFEAQSALKCAVRIAIVLTYWPARSQAEISHDDPDQQQVSDRDRASDERRRRRRSGRQARGRHRGPQPGGKNPARPRRRQARGVRGGQGHGAAGARGKRGAENAYRGVGSQARHVAVGAGQRKPEDGRVRVGYGLTTRAVPSKSS